MQRNRSQIKDSQVKKNLKWHILHLLRLNEETRQELIDRLSDMYIGYWNVNNELIDIHLSHLANEGLIKYLDKYEITKKGSDALSEND
ncbi:MAG: hypothetical protein KAW19_05805 [Candidatus Aminicenantes bacterium]|nr:hypothetical protein [Candidatus Aminicenantes bacterium]